MTTDTGVYTQTSYLLRRKVFTIFGAAFHVYGPDGRVLMYSKQKAFKLKEDIRLYTDESMQTELLTIKARNIIDFSAVYDVVDPMRQEQVGSLRRKGFKSLFRDEWMILDGYEREIGVIREDNLGLALVRRYLMNLIPQTFHAEVQGQSVAVYKQRFNPFIFKLELNFSPDTANVLDRRLGLAAGILLAAIEGRQQNNG